MTRTLYILVLLVVAAAVACGSGDENGAFNSFANAGDNDSIDDNNNVDDNDELDSCEPIDACRDYCHEKYARCLDANCDGGSLPDVDSREHQICMRGLAAAGEDGEPETILEGCVSRASASDEACRQFSKDAELYADQPCDGDEQRYRQCNELKLFMTIQSEDAYDACGCEPASTAHACTTDDECDSYGDGVCISGDDVNECSAECHQFDGVTMPLLPDPGCAPHNGICLHLGETYLDGPDGPSSICQQYCTGIEDCPDGASCAPVLQLQDGPLGLCTRGAMWDSPFPLCQSVEDCPTGTTCRDGTCQPSCSGNDTPCDVGGCGDDGYCEVDFQPLF